MTVVTDTTADYHAAAVLDPDHWTTGAPYPALAYLREHSPVHPVTLPDAPRTWLLTRHADVLRVSRDPQTYSSASGSTLLAVGTPPDSAMLPSLDPPRHTHFRRLINQGFTARNVLRLEPFIRQVTHDIVDDVGRKRRFDAVPDIAAELSLQVIAEVIGVPAEDRAKVFAWSNAIGSLGIEDADYAPTPEVFGQAIGEMLDYCSRLVARRRDDHARDDILAALLDAEVDGERLSESQLNEFFVLLAIAGNETTRNTLSHGILAFSEHPEQRSLIANDPTLIPLAVEELLRWATPVLHFRRTATIAAELGDQRIESGDWVLMHYLSANRDEAVFRDADRFDIRRDDAGQVAFGGGGTHFCLGAQLARLELRVMLEELYREFPELSVDGEPVRLRSSFFHGIKQLPCRVGPDA